MLTAIKSHVIGTLRRFQRDEVGGSYQLSFALVLPFYTLFIVFIIELSLLLSAKMAVTHATYAAARSAIVWMPVEDHELSKDPVMAAKKRNGMVYAAFVNAMAPTASGRHDAGKSSYFDYPSDAPGGWAVAYAKYSNGEHEQAYLARKWQYAAAASRIRIDMDETNPQAPITVSVEYEHPFHTSGAGRILGRVSSWTGFGFPTATIESVVVMEKEGFRNESQSLGINFHEDHGFVGDTFN